MTAPTSMRRGGRLAASVLAMLVGVFGILLVSRAGEGFAGRPLLVTTTERLLAVTARAAGPGRKGQGGELDDAPEGEELPGGLDGATVSLGFFVVAAIIIFGCLSGSGSMTTGNANMDTTDTSFVQRIQREQPRAK